MYKHTMYKHTATDRIHHPGEVVQGVRTRPGMSPEAWASLGCVPYTPPPVDPPPVVTEAQRIAAANPELPGTVRAALAALQSLVSIGVNLDLSAGLPGWQQIGPAIAARRLQLATIPDAYAALDAAADMADGYWRAVVYWCGSDATAYRLAPELAAIAD